MAWWSSPPPTGQPRDVHVHVCAAGSQWEHDHLLFRDYLRTHPAACARYAEAKRVNASRWSDDGWAYTEAKTGVVTDILGQAAGWARATGWAPPRDALEPRQKRGHQGADQRSDEGGTAV